MSAKIRSLKEEFVRDLAEGLLAPITNSVRRDKTLFLCVRHNYINIYYQGGNIMKVKGAAKEGEYTASFNINYLRNGNGEAKEIVRQEKRLLEMLPQGNITPAGFDTEDMEAETKGGGKVEEFISKLISEEDVRRWTNAIPVLKDIMDIYLSSHEKAERFYQQMVCRENTRSKISENMDYFITDIEYSITFPEPQGKRKTARIDMVAVKWPSENRKGGSGVCDVRLALIEMKYGDNAMTGASGIEEHLKDMIDIGGEGYEMIRQSTEKQLEILHRLGLMPGSGEFKVVCDTKVPEHKPEYIMLFANTSPGGEKGKQMLKKCKEIIDGNNIPFELKFFTANYAGYGLYKECVLDIERFAEIAGKV
jgi:hypothetical protein